MSSENPYTQPSSFTQIEESDELEIASQTQRFLTMIMDNIAIYGINYAFGMVVGALLISSGGLTENSARLINALLILSGWVLAFFYYASLELLTGRTLGKIVMGTKVVTEDGDKPSAGQILGRSACRFIPLEAFSFLIGTNSSYPVGWHDRIPGTQVVSARF